MHVRSSFNTRKYFSLLLNHEVAFLCQTLSFQSFTMQRQTGGVEAIDMKCSSCIQQQICVPLSTHLSLFALFCFLVLFLY